MSSLNFLVVPVNGYGFFIGGTPGLFNIFLSLLNWSSILGRSLSHGSEKSASNSSFSFAKANESLALHTFMKCPSHNPENFGAGGIASGSISFEVMNDKKRYALMH